MSNEVYLVGKDETEKELCGECKKEVKKEDAYQILEHKMFEGLFKLICSEECMEKHNSRIF